MQRYVHAWCNRTQYHRRILCAGIVSCVRRLRNTVGTDGGATATATFGGGLRRRLARTEGHVSVTEMQRGGSTATEDGTHPHSMILGFEKFHAVATNTPEPTHSSKAPQ